MDTPLIKLDFTVSARNKTAGMEIRQYLLEYYSKQFGHIKSVFGFLEYCPLYGGRQYTEPEITDEDVQTLYNLNIGLRIPLTNLYVTRAHYEESKVFLDKYHRKGNSIITVSMKLALWIRKDFPLYEIESSVIQPKLRSTLKEINDTLEVFDIVVLHGTLNLQTDLLESIKDKSRIRLFYNMGCSYNCPARICYSAASKINLGQEVTKWCSANTILRPDVGTTTFDIDKLVNMGFYKWKALPLGY